MTVENIIRDGSTNYAVVSDNLTKTYPGRDGNPKKLAVKDLSLALQLGECFGFLGPNGAGKSSFINMVCTYFLRKASDEILKIRYLMRY